MKILKTDLGNLPENIYSKFKFFTNLLENTNDHETELKIKILIPKKLHNININHIPFDNYKLKYSIKYFKIYWILEYNNLNKLIDSIIVNLIHQNYNSKINKLLIENEELKLEILFKTNTDQFIKIIDKYEELFTIDIIINKLVDLNLNIIYYTDIMKYLNTNEKKYLYLSKVISTHKIYYMDSVQRKDPKICYLRKYDIYNIHNYPMHDINIEVLQMFIPNITKLSIFEIQNLFSLFRLLNDINTLVEEIYKVKSELYIYHKVNTICELFTLFGFDLPNYLNTHYNSLLFGEIIYDNQELIPMINFNNVHIYSIYLVYKYLIRKDDYTNIDNITPELFYYINIYSIDKKVYNEEFLIYLIIKFNITLYDYLSNSYMYQNDHICIELFIKLKDKIPFNINNKQLFIKKEKEILQILQICNEYKICLNISRDELIYIINNLKNRFVRDKEGLLFITILKYHYINFDTIYTYDLILFYSGRSRFSYQLLKYITNLPIREYYEDFIIKLSDINLSDEIMSIFKQYDFIKFE